MKKLYILLLGIGLLVTPALADNTTDADQKWLAAVAKMVEQGISTVSTPSEERVTLAKNWAASKGFGTDIKKTAQGFQVTFSKSLATK
jgi:hypothetical protein